MKNIAIIGGGASGMIAAIEAASFGSSVTIYEKNARVGKKLLATGNGRCNLSNRDCEEKRYHGRDTSFILPALKNFDVKSTEKFFSELGIEIIELEEGKLYPYSLQASAVLDVLRMKLEELGVNTVCETEITDIYTKKNGFTLWSGDRCFEADAVILAAGGEASFQLGGTDSGYKLLKKSGHKIIPTLPSIVQLKTDMKEIKPLSGLKMEAKLSLLTGDKMVSTQQGELLFTDYGISGPPVLQLSGTASRAIHKGKKVFVNLDLLPFIEENELLNFLSERKLKHSGRSFEEFLVGFIPKRLGQVLFKSLSLSPLSRTVFELTEKDLKALAFKLKNFKIEVLSTNGMKNAQVTIGGADTSEFYNDTMESKIIPNLFVCGEVLDIDGDCGGFNLQWAWSSGRLAGESASK